MNAIAMIMINDDKNSLRCLQKTDRARSEVVCTLFRAKSGVSLGAGAQLPVRKADRRAGLLNAAEADVFVSVGERVGWEVRGNSEDLWSSAGARTPTGGPSSPSPAGSLPSSALSLGEL